MRSCNLTIISSEVAEYFFNQIFKDFLIGEFFKKVESKVSIKMDFVAPL